MRLRVIAFMAAFAACMTMTACGSGGSPTTSSADPASLSEEELVAQAKQEGKVDWITGGADGTEALARAFTNKYGIEVNVTKMSSGPLSQRISADMRSYGRINADAIQTTNPALLADLVKQGQAVVPDTSGFPEGLVDSATGLPMCQVSPVMIMYNTNVLGGWQPASWHDLLDPRLKGQLLVNDPKGSQASSGMWSLILRDPNLGEDFIKKIAESGYQPSASSLTSAEALGAGQGAVQVGGFNILLMQQVAHGAPIAGFYPTDPSPVVPAACASLSGGEHPNAGYLLMQYFLSREGQEVYVGAEHSASLYGEEIPDSAPLPEHPEPLPSSPDFGDQLANQTSDLPKIQSLLGFN